MKRTVLLIYPDYLGNQYGEDFYLAHTWSDERDAAIFEAQQQAARDNCVDDEPPPYEGFAVVAVFAGHIEELLQ